MNIVCKRKIQFLGVPAEKKPLPPSTMVILGQAA